jgi:hypothetical protein
MEALFPMLIWGNAMALLFLYIYRHKNTIEREHNLINLLIFSKICLIFSYFFTLYRDIFSDFISVNIGITMLFVGF